MWRLLLQNPFQQDIAPLPFSGQESFAGRVCKAQFPSTQNPFRISFSGPFQRRNSNLHLLTPQGRALSKVVPNKHCRNKFPPRCAVF